MSEAREEAERRWPRGWGNAIGDGTWRDGAINGFVLGSEWARAERAEQGETEGRREFAAAYRARNGNVIPLGAETVVQDDANAVRAEFEREDPEGPAYFVATRILPPWLPVPDTTNNESEDEK